MTMPEAPAPSQPATTRVPGVELYWIPVAAGTSRFQQLSLRLWEGIEACRARRPRCVLYHSALKLRDTCGATFTLEMVPAFVDGPVPPLMTGPVGVRGLDRFRLFRYQLRLVPGETLPDEQWAVSHTGVSAHPRDVDRVLALAPTVPSHTWGRRVGGTQEIWTSDSVISWLLIKAGLDLTAVEPPPGGRAPGWCAGIALATI